VSIGIDDNFFQLGGHSLKAAILMSRIHKAFDVKVPLTEMFEKPTIRDMAAFIRSAGVDRYASIELTEEKEYYVLSPAQERLYILQQMDESSTGYNVSAVVELEGDIDADGLEATFIKLIRRHESFRTSFEMTADKPVQKIHKEENTGFRITTVMQDFVRPFDLSKAPLLRVGLIKEIDKKYILIVDMHHIISDAVSTEVFIKDFAAVYAGEELPDLKLRYKDYSEWQDRSKEGEAIKKQEEYWLNQFAEGVSVLDLPADYQRPAVRGFAGRTVHFETGIKETGALIKMVSGEGESLTVFMVLAAVYAVFLSKISGSRDIVMGIPAAGRGHADLEQIIGVFVNTLPLRISLAGEQTLTALLNQVKERTSGAFDNREYQYEDLVEKVVINRDASRNPLFDVMLAMQELDIPGVEMPGLKLKPCDYEDGTSKFDLTLLVVEAGGKLSFGFEYSTRLFKKETIAGFIRYFNKIVTAVVWGDGDQRISAIEIISQGEKQQILFDFNDTYCDFQRDKTIHELFAEQAARTPDRAAVIGITSVTYAELNRKSDRLACFLKEKGVEADTIVGIMTERSVEMVIGILGILKAGGAYLPIDPDYPQNRIDYMLKDSNTKILLSEVSEGIEVVKPGELSEDHPTHLCYVIYTSGSTGKPKGVMTGHRALVNRLNWMQKAYPIGEGDVILQKTPFIFDVSVWELFWWGMEGASLCLLEPGGEKSPEAIAEAVEKHKITTMHFVPSMLSVLLEYLEGPGDKSKLSSLRQVFSSGEALTIHHVERFRHILDEALQIRLINLYGPTEAAIDVSYFNCVMEDIRGCIPIGRPIDNICLLVVSNDMHLQPVGIAGELCIGGEGLARGYLNRPELTAEKFDRDLWDYQDYHDKNQKLLRGVQGGSFLEKSPPGRRRQKFYRTGDLARWLWDGNIEFLGRIDFQVKIRGFRIELGEIEGRLLGHENIKEAAVLARGDGSGDHTIVAYIVAVGRLPAAELREYLSMELPDYMIPSYFVQLEKMPVTPNGKLDRSALPEPGTRAGNEYSYSAPGNRMEERLAQMWAEVLQVPVGIGIDDNFFHLGGHSLKAAVLVSRVHKEFNVRIPLAEMFKKPTIRGLSVYIKGAVEDKCESIKPVEKKEYHALSSAQKRLFILQQVHKEGTGYNMVSAAVLEGAVEKDRVQDVFIRLIMRHESLRTSFAMIEDQPVQKIHEEENSRFQITTVIQDFVRPFELSKPPLLRAGLIETGSGKSILMVDMHHIISDGISLEIFLKEFMAFYAGEKLPAVELRYKDYSEWQNSSIEREEIMKQGEYWRKQFETGIPVLDLPTDYVRPAIWGFKGNRIHFEISSEQTAALNRLALREGGTLYMVLLAAYNTFLAKVSNREDIVVGTPAAGRNHTDLEPIIGVFVNTLALRNYPAGEKTFIGFLRQIKERTLGAFENQEYQYEELVEKTAVNRNVGRNPLFDVMFVMQEMNACGVEVHGLKLLPFNYEKDTSLFDLILYVELAESLRFAFEYSTELFKKETVERFTGYFKKILLKAVEDPGIKISEIEIISAEEKKNLLFDFNHEIVEYPKDKTIHRLFEEQAERTPDNTAVVYEKEQISYKELDRKANRLAQYLKQKGVGSEIIVGLKVKRSIEMITGIIGILKAGGAYLPIDPDYPQERIDYMLKDSNARVLLKKSEIRISKFETNPNDQNSNDQNGTTASIVLNFEHLNFEFVSDFEFRASNLRTSSLAYIIYTSGTTGKPKGVMINHGNVVRLLINDKTRFNFSGNDGWTMFHSYCFDFSVWEMYGALFYGGKLVVVPKMVARDPGLFLEVLRKHNVTVLNQTPPAFYHLIDEELENLPGKELNIRYIIFGGEALRPVKLKEWQKKYPGTKLVNMFGITETTVHVTYKEITPVEIEINSRSIGKKIPTSGLYILDRNMRLLPMGVAGELCVSGEGVGRGYLNRPELTADKFIENPYKPGEVFYRSGDLVRLIENGEMEYLGRIDHQVQVRGFRVEPGEIESQLLKQRGIKEAIVIDGEDQAGETYLCAYITADEEMDIFKLRNILAGSLPGYMIPSYFMQVDHIPLTPNGKVDRSALPAPGANSGKEYMSPGNEEGKKLAVIWSEVLLLLPGSIGMDDDFFELGGHSLKAAALAAKIHKEFDVKVPLVEIFKTPTIRGLCTYIKGAAESRYVSVPLAEKREYYTLSPAQKRLYILYQMEEGESIVYNIPQIITMDVEINGQKLEQVFRALIQRHESLRTSFHMAANQPVQCIHDEVEFEIEQHPPAFIRPFDLSKAPLLRVGLMEVKNGVHLLVVDMHHIVSDGVSMQLLAKDFIALCKGEKLPPLRIQYNDYALWQNREIERGAVKNQEEYWMKEFAGDIPVTGLPLDYPRPAVQGFAGSSVDLTIDSSETRGLKKLAKSGGVTLYMMLLAMFSVFISKLSGNEDIVMGTPAAGRRHADLEAVIGMFVNTLPLRNYPSAQKPFDGFLYEVKEKTLKAFENQDYPFEALVENVSAARDISRNPLFDIMFNLQNQAEHTTDFPGKESYAYESRVSKFDMTLAGVEVGDELHFSLEYCTTLFKRETIERFIKYFKTMVSWILADPSGKIADIEIISGKEKQWILYDFNHTEAVYPAEKTIHELFEEQAARTPRHIAVKGTRELHEISITYSELNRKSNQLAGVLREKGVLADDIVGIKMEPSIEMITGILGILKSGAAYLPIDPDYPRERIDYMLKDSGAKVLLSEVSEALPTHLTHLTHLTHPTQLSYIIYTSGSTGQPKGVMVNHQPVINLLFYLDKAYPFGETDTYLLKTSYIFDVSVTELFGWFLNGGRLVVLPGGDEKDPRKILESVARFHVTHINFVPSMFNAFVETLHMEAESIDFLSSLKYIFLAGEALKPELVNRFRRIDSQVPLENLYGPTEAAVYAGKYSLSDWGGDSDIPIGRPVQNVELYVLDRAKQLQPIGISGELCIGGAGLARGYLNRPELTNKKFCGGPAPRRGEPKKAMCVVQNALRPAPCVLLSPPGRRRQKIYKTGDLARWLPDGNIEFLGRIDHQVKIRGYRIELEEIENRLLRHEDIIEAVALEKGGDNDKYICAYIVPAVDREVQESELRTHLSRTLPGYMIPAYFVQIESIPLTPSGKIDRKALPAPEIKAGEDYTAPGNETEKKLVEIWSGVLNLETGIIGIDANFFHLGGHSLKAIMLVSKIREKLNLRVPLPQIFKTPTVRYLAEYIDGALEDKYVSIEPIEAVEEREYYELSSGQKRIYFFQQMDVGGTSHNMPAVIVLEGVMDKDRLEEIIGKLVERHESFRTSFVKVDGNPVQKVHGRVEFEIEYHNDGGHGRVEDIIADFVRPFDLSRAPLLRAGLIKTEEKRHTLLIDMHHIITDGTSAGLFIKDFILVYQEKKLPVPMLRYKDFSKWQNNRIFSREIKDQEEYWLKEFEDELPGQSIPTDYPRPSFQGFAGDLITFEIEKKTAEHLERLAEETGTTMFMVLFAAYSVLLFKYTGQEDIVVGSPTAGREHPGLEGIIGMFANILALRNYPRPWKTFKDFLESVKENSLKALENRDYPFEMLVDKLDFKRVPGRSPLFDTVFAFRDFRDMVNPGIQVKDLKLVIGGPEHKTTHWDLLLEVQEKGENNGPPGFSLEYGTQLFKKETIERLGKHFINILKTAAADPGILLSEIDMLSEGEKEKIWEFSHLSQAGDYDFG
jgi:amino acid adenylation domain-containing protein